MNINFNDLNELPIIQLKQIAKKFNVQTNTNKHKLIQNILEQYYDIKKYISYTYIKQLGAEGKDGRSFLAKNEHGEEFAIKIFKKNKSSIQIEREAQLQKIASEYGISPKIKEYDSQGKFIVMDKLDVNLYDLFCKQNGKLTKGQQKEIINLFKKLDKCGVFHADPNPLNFMNKHGKWYIIDFGFAKLINNNLIAKYGETPNITYMPLGFKLKLQEIHKDVKLDYIEQYCPDI